MVVNGRENPLARVTRTAAGIRSAVGAVGEVTQGYCEQHVPGADPVWQELAVGVLGGASAIVMASWRAINHLEDMRLGLDDRWMERQG